MVQRFNILVLEGQPSDLHDLVQRLQQADIDVEITHAGTRAAFLAELNRSHFDAIISEYDLPDIDGKEAITLAKQISPHTPLIIFTGTVNEEAVVECMRLGASDFVSKQKPARIVPAILSAVANSQSNTEKQSAFELLRRSEEQYRKLADNFPNGSVCIYDRNLRLIFVAGQQLEQMGRRAAEFIGKTFQELSPPETFANAQPHLQAAFEGKPGSYETSYWGNTYYQVNVAPLQPGAGPITQIMVISQDITDRRQTEHALRESEERYRILAEASHDLIIVIDREGRIDFTNSIAARLLGVLPQDLLRKQLTDIFPPHIAERQMSNIQKVFDSGTSEYVEAPIIIDGKTTWLSTWLVPIKDKGVEKVLVISRDMTERKHVDIELRRSHELLDKTIAALDQAVFVVDPTTRHIISANLSAERVFGYNAQELIGKTTEFLHVDHEHFVEFGRLLFPALDAEGIFRTEFRMRRKNGNLFSTEITVTEIRDETGKRSRVVSAVRDISDRKTAEEAIEEHGRQLQALLASLDDIVFEFDEKGTYLNVWSADESLLVRPKSELLGRTIDEILGESGRPFSESVKRVLSTGTKENIEYALDVNGRRRWFVARVSSVSSGDHARATASMLIRDITDRKAIEDQMRQAQKLESIGTLAGGIAHDFNNILGIIMAHSSLIEQGKSSQAELAAGIKSITKATQRGTGLVKQLLTFARKSDVLLESVQMNDTVHEVVKLLFQTLPKSVTVETKLAEPLPSVVADVTQLHQVLLNLSVNARDAMPKGGTLFIETSVAPGILVRSRFPDAAAFAYIKVAVRDTGTGMNEQTKTRMFEPFFTTKELGKGTGLGLATVFGIVQAHKGFIDVESEIGKGTTFTIFLPVPARPLEFQQSESAKTLPAIGGSEVILLIEDEEELMSILQFILTSKGYTVLSAKDGMEGIRMFTENKDKISLVVSDMGLPGLEGSVVFSTLKTLDPKVKFILASGFVEPNMKSEMFKAGMKEFIQKPYLPEVLLKKVREALDS